MRITLGISPAAGWTYPEVRELAQGAEAAGFGTFWVADHFFGGDGIPDRDCLEAWTLLAALARETTTLRLGTLVTAHSYRNPALLAKQVATVDHLSGGRVEFGLGAGWKVNEYLAYGYEFPPPGVRVAQLRDTLEICTRLWTGERATYTGRHYRIEDALASPKPVQRPYPPITIGGTKPRIMRVAARYADVFNLGRVGTPPQVPDRALLAALMVQVAEACAAVGRERPLAISHWAPVDRPDDAALAALAARAGELADAGVVEYQLMISRDDFRRTLERLARSVLPAAA